MTESVADDIDPDEVDKAAVLRAMDGDLSVPLNGDEILTVIDRLHARGIRDGEIAQRLGVTQSAVESWRFRRRSPISLSAFRGVASREKPTAPGPPVQTPPVPQRPLTSVPTPSEAASAPSIEALVNAAERSTSARTRQMGAVLVRRATELRQRLSAERAKAEETEARRREREAAAAEVARLKAMLIEAQAKASGLRTPGKRLVSDAGRAAIARNAVKAHEAQRIESLCRKGCGFVAKSTPGRASHERHCAGAS